MELVVDAGQKSGHLCLEVNALDFCTSSAGRMRGGHVPRRLTARIMTKHLGLLEESRADPRRKELRIHTITAQSIPNRTD